MKKIALILVATALIMGCVLNPTFNSAPTVERIYDNHGMYKGRIDSYGRIYDNHGKYRGRIEK